MNIKIDLILLPSVCILFAVVGCSNFSTPTALNDETEQQGTSTWQETFNLDDRLLQPTGRNRFFVLEPGFQIVLEGRNEKVTITVLDETVEIAGFTTRVVEETEWKNGELVEISRNFFAIDPETADVFYFGEEVDDYRSGEIISHGGAWLAGKNNAKAGLIMPGQPSLGQKYYQEIAPGVAMDRAEITSLNKTLETPFGVLKDSLETQETTPLNPVELSFKTYAPEIGLIQDGFLLLTEFGFLQE